MLTQEEKLEMLDDAKNSQRRHSFAFSKKMNISRKKSLDEFLVFLTNVYQVFPFPQQTPQKTITKFNRL
ncbi:MAG: hypothetical protein NUV91_01410 [Candidatus Omnitrophica bacterium]|nr:hypothetical protein [Candidatus Omnitrophota bacterium]